MIADLALLTESRYVSPTKVDWYVDNILTEDRLLAEALARRGLTSRRVDWARPDFDWGEVQAAVFRTTWDYYERGAEFQHWLERVRGGLRLFNSADQVAWNLDKHYLEDLAQKGVAAPPTVWLEPGDPRALAALIAESGWSEAVVKPAISGAARLTFRFDAATAVAVDQQLESWRKSETFLVQPFQARVQDEGEISLIVVAGELTHAVRKRARPGDFRVQDDHGGTVHPHEPAADEVAFAECAVAACAEPPVYARVDAVRGNDGELLLMELELIEPELFLRFHPAAAEAMAEEIARRL